MKRLYYLTDSLDFAGQVSRQLLRIPDFSQPVSYTHLTLPTNREV